MDNKIKRAALFAAVMMAVSLAGCSEKKQEDPAQTFSVVSIVWELPQADDLRKQIVGDWGRLGEVMHEFYDDNTCIIGGMFGDYEISDSGSLILTTTSGTKTEYVYGDDTAPNYWELENDTLTVNGNQFSRIASSSADEADSTAQ